MMAKYCLDTSGLSNPLETMPEDIFGSLWSQVKAVIHDEEVCCNKEILDELTALGGSVGECIGECAADICYEIGDDGWDWKDYLTNVEAMRVTYKAVISEYNGNRKSTVGLNDISIIALAKTLELPVISMEKPNTHQPSERRMRIPDVCAAEGVEHLTFNDFLRAEGIKL